MAPPGIANPDRRTIDLTKMKERMTFTKYSIETSDEYTEFNSVLAPGHHNPEHYMDRTKATMMGRDGMVTGTVNGKKFTLEPGQTVVIEKGQRYSVQNEGTQDAEMIVRMEPGVESFEKAMYCIHGLMGDGETGEDGMPTSFVQLAIIVGMMEVKLTGWDFWLARPLLAVARKVGQALGIESDLLKHYWSV